MKPTIYKLYNPRTEEFSLSTMPSKHLEIVEEFEVPDGEDAEEYLEQLLLEVDLGDMCERRTKY